MILAYEWITPVTQKEWPVSKSDILSVASRKKVTCWVPGLDFEQKAASVSTFSFSFILLVFLDKMALSPSHPENVSECKDQF